MSDGKVKWKFCKISTCCNQPQENSIYCIIHYNLRQNVTNITPQPIDTDCHQLAE